MGSSKFRVYRRGVGFVSGVLSESFVFALRCLKKLENGTLSLGNGLEVLGACGLFHGLPFCSPSIKGEQKVHGRALSCGRVGKAKSFEVNLLLYTFYLFLA